jgi:hypothetical protein
MTRIPIKHIENAVPALQDTPTEVAKLKATVNDIEGRLRKTEYQIMNLLAFKSNMTKEPLI